MKRLLLISIHILFSSLAFAQNKDISAGAVFEGEPYLAVDPSNPQHLVIAWMGYVPLSHLCIKVKTSFDGGNTWSSANVIKHQSGSYTSADVSIVFDHLGNVYASYIDSRQSPDSGGVYISKSVDGGLTWGASNLVISLFADGSKNPLDRPWLVIGKGSGSSPDTMYVTTKPAPWIAPPNRPYFVRSYDYGVTWSAWKYIDSTGFRVGNVIQAPMAAPAVDSAGKFHCVYPAYYPAESIYPRYILASPGTTSSFSYNVVFSGIGTSPIDTLAKAGGRLVCDPTNNKHYVFFSIQNYSTDLDVYYTETFNGGTSWSTPKRVNDDAIGNGKMQDLVWGNFDEHGNLVAAWRDRRNAPGMGYQQPSEIWGAVKWKDSTFFSSNFRVSDTIVAYDSAYLSGNGNDFMNVTMAQDTLTAAWGDVRTGALNIWLTRRNMSTGAVSGVQNIVSEKLPDVNIYPNPTTSSITIEGDDLEKVSLYDITGRLVLQLSIRKNKIFIDVSKLSSGTYFATVQTAQGLVTEQVVKQ